MASRPRVSGRTPPRGVVLGAAMTRRHRALQALAVLLAGARTAAGLTVTNALPGATLSGIWDSRKAQGASAASAPSPEEMEELSDAISEALPKLPEPIDDSPMPKVVKHNITVNIEGDYHSAPALSSADEAWLRSMLVEEKAAEDAWIRQRMGLDAESTAGAGIAAAVSENASAGENATAAAEAAVSANASAAANTTAASPAEAATAADASTTAAAGGNATAASAAGAATGASGSTTAPAAGSASSAASTTAPAAAAAAAAAASAL
eukprot:TRINITY_DN23381_c0_g1_i4.p1 TRINITY_DN23381_c0_g1~~TRINITY_DN23381_c0_g1_i4.p1  ORF type:complete len:266 (+),score=70.32 TRINITY_DN23381_c0_g1_i4:43-840(+)